MSRASSAGTRALSYYDRQRALVHSWRCRSHQRPADNFVIGRRAAQSSEPPRDATTLAASARSRWRLDLDNRQPVASAGGRDFSDCSSAARCSRAAKALSSRSAPSSKRHVGQVLPSRSHGSMHARCALVEAVARHARHLVAGLVLQPADLAAWDGGKTDGRLGRSAPGWRHHARRRAWRRATAQPDAEMGFFEYRGGGNGTNFTDGRPRPFEWRPRPSVYRVRAAALCVCVRARKPARCGPGSRSA